MYKYKVCVRCSTYNHANYIEDAMNSFVKQITDFPYVCIIMDDASTDNTGTLINEFVNNHFIEIENNLESDNDNYLYGLYRHKRNSNCHFAVYCLKFNHHSKGVGKLKYQKETIGQSKYFAFCEGDDYWTDPMKLQKQVDALERDESITMVYTSFKTVDFQKHEINLPTYCRHIKLSKSGFILPRLLKNNYIMTLTVMLRKELFEDKLYKNAPRRYDYTYFLSAASRGRVVFLDDVTGCYRITSSGATATRNEKIQESRKKVSKYFSFEYLQHHIDEAPMDKTALYVSIVMCNLDSITDMKKILSLKKNLLFYVPIACFVKVLDSLLYRMNKDYDAYSLLFHI